MARQSGYPRVDIGPVGSIEETGRIPGMGAAKHAAGLLIAGYLYHRKNRTRDFNDEPANAPVRGSIGGRTVKPTQSPQPKVPKRYEGTAWDPEYRRRMEEQRGKDEPFFDDPSSYTDDEWEERTQHAHEMGKQAHRIAEEKAPPWPKHPKGPLDTTDLTKGTP